MSKKVSIITEALSDGNRVFLDSYDDAYDQVVDGTFIKQIRNERQIYQDIISMWFELRLNADNKDEFSITDIGNYLLKHHRPFINEFARSPMNQANRLQSKRTYIENRIKHLVKLDILYRDRYDKAEKNNTKTPIYKFTLDGKVLSWLIVCEKREGDDDNIHAKYIDLFANELLPVLLKLDSGILTQFMVDFFTHALKQHQRELVIDFFEKTFESLNEDYLYKARFYFFWLINKKVDPKLFLDTLHMYDKKKQELVLFQIKMDLECAIEIFMNGEFKEDWEIKRYTNIENPYIVMTSTSCLECGLQHADQIDLLAFLGIKGSDDTAQKNQHIDMQDFKCRKCGSTSHHLDFFSLLDLYYLLDKEFRYLVEL